MTAAFRARIWPGTPDDHQKDYLEHCHRQLDYTMNDAIADAINEYWIILPPTQARVIEEQGGVDYFFREPSMILMRRVRVMRATTDGAVWGGDNMVMRARWALDPLESHHDPYPNVPWEIYKPLYDEEKVKGDPGVGTERSGPVSGGVQRASPAVGEATE